MKIEKDFFPFVKSCAELTQTKSDFEIVECPCCGFSVRFPLIARQSDIEKLQATICCAEEILEESGLSDKIKAKIYEKLNNAIKKQ